MKHLKYCLQLLLLVVLYAPSPVCGQPAFNSQEEVTKFIEFYYTNPKPELVGSAINFIVFKRFFGRKNSIAPVIGFFFEVYSQNPSRVHEWKALITDLPKVVRPFFQHAIAMTGHPMKFIESEPFAARRNDICWGAFYASGDKVYLNFLLNQVSRIDERKNLSIFLAAGTAKWSLASNAQVHLPVKAAIETAIQSAPESHVQHYRDMLKKPSEQIWEEVLNIVRYQRETGNW